MSNRERERITVYDVIQAATESGEWVNGEFLAVVRNPTARQGNKPSKADLCDPDNPNIKVKAAAFGPGVDFMRLEGATCLFGGQGMKVKDYRGDAEVSLSDKSTVNVVTAAGTRDPKAAALAAGAKPDPRTPAPATITPAEQAAKFHRTMKKTALLYLHADQYVADIEEKRKKPFDSATRQAAVSSLFITAKDKGLLDIAPALRELDAKGLPVPFVAPKAAEPDPEEVARKAAEAAEEARKRHEAEEAARRAANLDEDVPF